MNINQLQQNTAKLEAILNTINELPDAIDLSQDTVTEEALCETITAHNKEGVQISGKFPINEVDAQSNLIQQINRAIQNKGIEQTNSNLLMSVINRTISTLDPISNLSSVGGGAFMNCAQLQNINLPNCTTIGSYAFSDCTAIKSINLPQCTQILNYGFCYCSSLQEVSLPMCSFLGLGAFYGNTLLSKIFLPNCQKIGPYAFAYCSRLSEIKIAAPTLSYSAFLSCKALTTFINTYSSVASIVGGNILFQNTPITDSTYTGAFGSIYVPASLVSAYQSHSQWKEYASRITSYYET